MRTFLERDFEPTYVHELFVIDHGQPTAPPLTWTLASGGSLWTSLY
jgi:hypothetical protein